MSNLLKELVIVVLDCPYDTISNPETQRLLGRTAALKIEGYRQQYDYGVLPVDTTDYIATHQLVCRETADGWVPLTGYKSTTLDRAKKHGIVFPGLGLVLSAKAADHESVVRDIMKQCEDSNRRLAYTSAWTMDPSLAKDRETRVVLRDMFEAMYVLYHLDAGIDDVLVGGTLRFKTEVLFNFWGHESIRKDGIELPAITVPHLLGEQVTVMHLKRFTKEAIAKVQPWRFHWNRRVVISGDPVAKGLLMPDRVKKAA